MNNWWRGEKGEWYVVVQFVLFGLMAFGPREVAWLPRWQVGGEILWLVVGGLVGLGGAVLLGLGIVHLGQNLTAVPHPKTGSSLVQTGAYAIVRHPIYSGIIIGSLGWALLSRSPLMLLYALVLLLFFDVKSRREEQWLSEKFAAYGEYQERVKKLLPFLY